MGDRGWSWPDLNWIKVNCDANLEEVDFRAWGLFSRDVDGKLVAIDMWKMEGFNNPMVVEVMEIYKAMEVDVG